MFTFDLHSEVFCALLIVLIVITTIILKVKGHLSFWRIAYFALIICYVLLLIKVVVCPIVVGAEAFMGKPFELTEGVQLIPFFTVREAMKYHNWIQIVGNLILLVPLPILLSMSKKAISRGKLCVIVFLTSLGIECVQLLINICSRYNSHVFDIDDLLLNVIGGWVCILIMKPHHNTSHYGRCKGERH